MVDFHIFLPPFSFVQSEVTYSFKRLDFLQIRPERCRCTWTRVFGAANVARNSLVLILFCLLLEVGHSESESESLASVLGCSRFCKADLVLVSVSPQSLALVRIPRQRIIGAISGEVYRLNDGESSCGFDTPPAGAKCLSETFDCLPLEC